MRGSDYVLMVTEPTPFGLHDLRLAVEVARDELGLPVAWWSTAMALGMLAWTSTVLPKTSPS